MSRFDRHVRGDAVKWFVAFFLIIVLLFGVVCGGLELYGTGKVKPSNWGKDEVADVVDPADPADPENPGTQPGEGDEHDASENHGMKLMAARIPIEMYEQYGISPASVESAYTITATIEPDNATNKEVDWTVYFKDESSEWATGKTVTDYVSISPTEAQCVVTCVQAFGEPIMVKVASHEDASIFATKQFDYVKRLKENRFDLSNNKTDFCYNVPFGDETGRYITFYKSFTVGTIDGEIKGSDATLKIKNSKFMTQLKETDVVSKVNELLGDDIVDYNEDDHVFSNPLETNSIKFSWTLFFKTKNESRIEEIGTKAINMLKSALSTVAQDFTTHYWDTGLSMTTTISVIYKGNTIQTQQLDWDFTGFENRITVGITDLKFEDSGNMFF